MNNNEKICAICTEQMGNVLALAANDDYRLRKLNREFSNIMDFIIIRYVELTDDFEEDDD